MPSAEDTEMTEAPARDENEEDRFLRMSIEFLDDTKAAEAAQPSAEESESAAAAALASNVAACRRAGAEAEERFVARALRHTGGLRRALTAELLAGAVWRLPEASAGPVLSMLNAALAASGRPAPPAPPSPPPPAEGDACVEEEAYLRLLLVLLLLDGSHVALAADAAQALVDCLANEGRHTVDGIRARAYFYLARAHELDGRLALLRPQLLAAYRTAVLRHWWLTQATVLNLLLRSYLACGLFAQAQKLLLKTSFREETSASELARYLYYTGRIQATQLEYTEAYKCLLQAGRKAPQHTALGFRKAVAKLTVIVQLLLGEVPERSLFRQAGMAAALRPYFRLTDAVRVGDLAAFQAAVAEHEESFRADGNHSLIQRLRRNVIKTGLRKVNLSYSRIHLADVCAKLHLDSAEDAEFIVAKAIRDGVIDASLDHASRTLQSRASPDVYSSQEPLEAFHRRISFCLNLHNDAVMAMRFPAAAPKRLPAPKEPEVVAEELAEDDDEGVL